MLDIHRKNTLEKSFYFLRSRTNVLVERHDEFKSLAYYVGWMPNEFLILKPSSQSDLKVKYPLYKKLIARYLIANLLYSFEAKVLYDIIEPASLIFLEQPKHVEVLSLRKYERTGCLISAKVNIQSRSFDGIIVDISNYGMKIILDSDVLVQRELEFSSV
ncbi:PilZ domain-containing protein [Desulfovulcanus sp.]